MSKIRERTTVRGHEIPVDIEQELSSFEWNKRSIRGDKLLACSPFRKDGNERHPSFAVRLDNGVWIDSGAHDDAWKKGSFVRLLSFLRREQEEETEDYLLSTYAPYIADADDLSLDFDLTEEPAESDIVLPYSLLDPLRWRSPYLLNRGISEETQRLFRIGYDKQRKAISIPWFNKSGQLANIKFRSVTDKRFWYWAGGDRIRKHVYGLNIVIGRGLQKVFVTESEIDALYLWTHGFPAVALGGANLTDRQRMIFLKSPIRELVIATDNDIAGQKIGDRLSDDLSGWIDVSKIALPAAVKDVNELSPAELAAVAQNVDAAVSFL